MSYDEVEIEDMTWDDKLQAYTYPCPCGDFFGITLVRCRAASLSHALRTPSQTRARARMMGCAATGRPR
jgi:hypothetical protein